MAALHGAVALAQVDDVAVPVAQNLELDVSRAREILLDVDLAVAERGERFGPRQLKRSREILRVGGDAHSLSAAAGRRLDDHGKADFPREPESFVRVVNRPVRARNDRHSDVLHRLAGGGLVAHEPDLLRGRSDEVDVGRDARLGELRVLGEETVAGMDGVGAGDLGGGDDARDVEVGLARRSGPDADVVVGEAHVERFAIRFGVHGHRLDAELATGANHTEGNFSAISD